MPDEPRNTLSMLEQPARDALTPERYARQLLQSLGQGGITLPRDDRRDEASLWAESGAKAMTGPAASPLQQSMPLAACMQGAWLALSALSPGTFDPDFPAFRLLSERAALMQLNRRGRESAGGACRFYQLADGWLALSLARDSDRELLAAWLSQSVVKSEDLPDLLRDRMLAEMEARARELGLAAAALHPPQATKNWFSATPFAQCSKPNGRPLVLDLSSLWAGPLCAQLLRQSGARVIKLESEQRPDGARSGNQDFYELLNAGKESVSLPLHTVRGKQQLQALLRAADIVIEASRPRALEQMGIDAAALIAAKPGKVWLSITAYGRNSPMREWIGYGDDAAVAAGMSWHLRDDEGVPVFCADAIADPLTGIHAALLALQRWQQGGGELLDISLSGVAGFALNSSSRVGTTCDLPAESPLARPVTTQAAALGADTESVLREFCRGL